MLLVLVGTAVACAGTSTSETSTAPTSTTAAVPTAKLAGPLERAPELGSGKPVTLAFAGDVHFESYLRPLLDADPATMLADIAPVLSSADIAVVNLETAITDGGTQQAKEFTFRAPATAFDALRAAGVDVASMANNHGLDFGQDGLADSLAAAAAADYPVIGVGTNAAEAYASYRVVVRGQRLALLAATQVLDASLQAAWTATDTNAGVASAKEVDRLVAAVAAARADSDTVVVFLHWGTEGEYCPTDRQRDLAAFLVEAGADIVVGGHAHRVQSAGYLGGALVGYGLGNFVWYAQPGPSSETGVLVVTATGRSIDAYRWEPARITDGTPVPLEVGSADATEALATWDERRECTGLAP